MKWSGGDQDGGIEFTSNHNNEVVKLMWEENLREKSSGKKFVV